MELDSARTTWVLGPFRISDQRTTKNKRLAKQKTSAAPTALPPYTKSLAAAVLQHI